MGVLHVEPVPWGRKFGNSQSMAQFQFVKDTLVEFRDVQTSEDSLATFLSNAPRTSGGLVLRADDKLARRVRRPPTPRR